jgi:hypothetical protein
MALICDYCKTVMSPGASALALTFVEVRVIAGPIGPHLDEVPDADAPTTLSCVHCAAEKGWGRDGKDAPGDD